jgi:hypothetical protein
MSDDDFDFSDHDLDDLPANTIEQFEAAAILATQQQTTQHAASESDYGLDDGDEVINLDDQDRFAQAQQGRAHDSHATYDAYDAYEEGTTIDEGNTYQHEHEHEHEHMQLVEPPRQSQADPDQLLSRIKKVGQLLTSPSPSPADG